MTAGMHRGVIAALAAAVLFGAGTPFAKLLLAHTSPWMLAALLYLGSGIGLWIVRRVRRAPSVHFGSDDWRWLAGAIVAGGIVGPVLLMLGLSGMPASGASLLLNAEGVLTAFLAWFAFKENFDRRIALGMLAIVAGAVVLSWPQEAQFAGAWSALAVVGACLAWAIDNNLTRKVSLSDASFIAMIKGLVAGSTNLSLTFLAQATWPGIEAVVGAALLGFASYGVSLTLFVIGLRHLGTAALGRWRHAYPLGRRRRGCGPYRYGHHRAAAHRKCVKKSLSPFSVAYARPTFNRNLRPANPRHWGMQGIERSRGWQRKREKFEGSVARRQQIGGMALKSTRPGTAPTLAFRARKNPTESGRDLGKW